MAKKPLPIPDEDLEVFADDPPAVAPVMLTEDAPEGSDYPHVVHILTRGPCRTRSAKSRQIRVQGVTCEHVADAPDGTWVYEPRTT